MIKTSAEDNANLTEGSILYKIGIFAIPILAGNLLQELYNLVDTLIVGQTLGVEKLAAVGSAGCLIFVVIGFLLGMTGGCSVLTANSYGAKDEKALKKSVAAHIIISMSAGITLTLISTMFTEPLLSMLRTTPQTFKSAELYLFIMYAGMPAAIIYNLCSSSLRAIGDSKTPLKFLVVSSVLNIVLDLLFIMKFGWDVAGAAWATVISELVSGLLCLGYIIKNTPLLIPEKDSWKDLKDSILFELKVGVPMGLQFSFIASGFMVLQYVLNGFGHEAVAAFTIGGKIQSLMNNPLIAMCVVMATFAGQNTGARKFDRIKTGVAKVTIACLAMTVLGGGLIWIFSDNIILMFIKADEARSIALTKQILEWSCPSMWLLTFVFISRGALQGLGDGVTPMIGAVLEFIMRTALPLGLCSSIGFTSVCVAGPAAWFACGLMTTIVYLIRIKRSAAEQLKDEAAPDDGEEPLELSTASV